MSTLTYITTCKGRLEHLRQTLPRVVDQPGVSCVVVDYGCPDRSGDWVVGNFPQVTVVRATGDSYAGWNASRARNLGVRAATAPWLAFFDADILLSPSFFAAVLPGLARGHFYRATPVTLQTWGSIICHSEDFKASGGYDEAFQGWGGEDDDLRLRLGMLGRVAGSFPASLLQEIAHGDELRVRFHEIKVRALQHRINLLYLQVKLDLLRCGIVLGQAERRTLFQQVKESVRQAMDAGQPVASVEVNLPGGQMQTPCSDGRVERWSMGRKWVYSVELQTGDVQQRER